MSRFSQLLVAAILTATVIISGCSEKHFSATTISVNDDRLSEATVADPDGIKSIVGLQRIPSGAGYLDYTVDFIFKDVGVKKYNIFLGGMFDVVGTVVHIDVTDMNGNKSYLFIRSTATGYQTGLYEKE